MGSLALWPLVVLSQRVPLVGEQRVGGESNWALQPPSLLGHGFTGIAFLIEAQLSPTAMALHRFLQPVPLLSSSGWV